jgi:hypothetical protein
MESKYQSLRIKVSVVSVVALLVADTVEVIIINYFNGIVKVNNVISSTLVASVLACPLLHCLTTKQWEC